jgi:ABC-2 type transport system permease protein
MIPVNTAPMGSPAKFTPAPWYYSPLLQPSPQHVIGKNINRVKSEFVSSIDTVGKSLKVKKTVILATSKASLISQTPLEVSLESINHPPDRRLFNQTSQTVGILLEGTFSSVFKNRMTTSFGMNTAEIKAESETTKMIVIADGNLMANKYRMTNGKFETMELGYDQFSKQTFGNKAFLLNSVHYLCDDKGLMALRANDFKIRLLDKVKWREEKFQWQLLNMVLPLLLIGLLGIAYVYVRKRIYNS